jgi:hypothetical protein
VRIFRTLPTTLAAFALSLAFLVSPAHAQTRAWVSGTGDDANTCSRTAPCKTIAGALPKIEADGEVDCLDAAGLGSFTITKSVTIDCHEVFGSVGNATGDLVLIAFDSFGGSDVRKTVVLRNLIVMGYSGGAIGVHITGAGAGSFVHIEDCVINGNYTGTEGGIVDERARGTLTVNNTTIRDVGGTGISVVAPSSGSHRATITNTRVVNTNVGILAGLNTEMVVVNSVVSSALSTGLVVNSGGQMNIRGTTVAHNTTGMQASGVLNLSNSDVSFNSTGFTGTINSHGNNSFDGNGALGTITLIGAPASPSGLR